MFENVDFVECVLTPEDSGIGKTPDKFPEKGKIYTVNSSEKGISPFEEETYLYLEELPDATWNSSFFRPITRDIISECLDMSIDEFEEIEQTNYKTKILENV